MPITKFSSYSPSIAQSAYIAPSAEIIGKVFIGEDSSIWPTAVLRADIQEIKVGERTNLQDGVICHVTRDSEEHPGGYALILGDDITVGHRVVLHGCTIQNLCLIGIGAVIMDGVLIKSKVIIGAGSLVPPGKILESGLWLGTPVKRIRDLTPTEHIFLSHSAKNYVELKNLYLAQQTDLSNSKQ
jgi:carbonic anhydrase/acetyltransferase-like protein (isoleucine patch superfamily)